MEKPAKVNWGLGYRGAESTKEVQQKGLSHFVHGSTSKSGAKEACQEVRRDVRQGVRHEVLQRAAVSYKPKVVHQCNNMKVRHEIEHKKVECFAHEKSKNMAKKVNKTFTKPKRVEEVLLAKSGLLDEPGHEVVCDTKGNKIEMRQEVMRGDLQECDSEITPRQLQRVQRALGVDGEGIMVKKTTHEGSQVLNRSWSKGSLTGASGRDAVLVIPLQQGLCHDYTWRTGRLNLMHISWGRKACVVHIAWGRKAHLVLKFPDILPEVVTDVVAEADVVVSGEDHVESRDRDTKDDLIERDKLLEVFWDRTEAVTEVLDGKET
ncbi:hypothetical protein IGI04_026647 [Brassica rapa subsp. trilocularis]|uniref:DUF4283 domain-containing protein n=1 Tax=Brassica rapa subsp. trilocularis TaxID=1813537 RepID=A0ABQ7KZC0_BRACM|nr:hypothetical protein IGI04_026647 [Brassica rapa subsp. trilocularis]